MNAYREKKKQDKLLQKHLKEERKKEQQRRKKLRSTMDWIDIEEVTPEGVKLRDHYMVKGVTVEPEQLLLLSSQEKGNRIDVASLGFDSLDFQLYYDFSQKDPRLDESFNYLLDLYESAPSVEVKYLIQTQLEKIEFYEDHFKEIKFYLMIKQRERDIEEIYIKLQRLLINGGFRFKPMDYDDYTTSIYNTFRNPNIKDYYFTQLDSTTSNRLEGKEHAQSLYQK